MDVSAQKLATYFDELGLPAYRWSASRQPLVGFTLKDVNPEKNFRNCFARNLAAAIGNILLDMAFRWADGSGGISTPGKWNVIAWAAAAFRYIPMLLTINSDCDG